MSLLNQMLPLVRLQRAEEEKGKKRKDKVTLEGFFGGFGTSLVPALLLWPVLCKTDQRSYRCLLSHECELLLVLPRNELFSNDLPTLMKYLGLFWCAKSSAFIPVPVNQVVCQAGQSKPFSLSSPMLQDAETLWFLVAIRFFGFAPGDSATKQLMAFSDCRWDLFCSWALALSPFCKESRLAALAGEEGQLLLQWQGRQGPSEGSCAAQAQGCFERAGRDIGYRLSEIAVSESQENPAVLAGLRSTMGQWCPSPLPRRLRLWNVPSHVTGAAGPQSLSRVAQAAVFRDSLSF